MTQSDSFQNMISKNFAQQKYFLQGKKFLQTMRYNFGKASLCQGKMEIMEIPPMCFPR